MLRLERTVAAASNWFNYVACAAVVVMMLLSCADVFLRLVSSPIPGTYEMVGLLGAVIIAFAMAYTSLQRGHVAVEMIYEKLPPRTQIVIDSAGSLIGAALFGMIAWQSAVYGIDLRQSGEVSLTLQMPLYPIVYGIAFGCGLLALVLLMDLIKSFKKGPVVVTPTAMGLLSFVVLVGLMFLKIPVGFVMALVGFAGFGLLVSWDASLNLIARDFFSVFSSYNLTVIPLFVLMGQVAFHSGISSRLFHTAHKFLGHLPGGLAIATIGACAGFSAICGSTSATAATMAAVALPEMKKYDYDPALATGVVAAGGSLGILIPPSTIFIIYGIMTEQSVGKLFMSGVLPGILLTVLFIVTILIWTKLQPEICKKAPKATWKERAASLTGVIETFILFFMVMGGLFVGFFTPTEAAAIGAFGTLLIALVGRNLSWRGFMRSLDETTRVTCMIFVIVAGATVFGHFLAVTGIPANAGAWVASLSLPPPVIIGLIILVYLVLGCLMDSLAMIMLTIPVFFPVVTTLGYDPIWFGVIVVLVTGMGVITPPIGINVYVVAGVARDVPLQVIFRGATHLLMALLVTAVLLILFPQIATYLPSLMK